MQINVNAQGNYGEQIIVEPIQSENNQFGSSVSIDGNYAVVGSPRDNNFTGAANVFKKDENGNWNHIQKLTAFIGEHSFDRFAASVHIQGDFIFIGTPYDRLNEVSNEDAAGSVMIYKNNGADNFVGIQRIRSLDIEEGDVFGFSIDSFGDFLVISAPYEDTKVSPINLNTINNSGSAYVFKKDAVNDEWNQIQKIVPSHRDAFDRTGGSIAISQDYIILSSRNDTDTNNLNPVPGNGSVFVFKKDAVNDVWVETQKLKGTNTVDNINTIGVDGIDIDGDYITAGANSISSIYMFKVNNINGIWSQTQKISVNTLNSAKLGRDISLKNNILIATAPSSITEINGVQNISSGSAFIFKNNNENWGLVKQIIPTDGEENGNFGGENILYTCSVVDFDGTQFIIGSPDKDGEVGGNTLLNSGKAYISGNIDTFLEQTFTWTGAVSTDWNTAGNWDTNSVPTATDDVVLADVANAPRINFNQSHTVKDLTINENLTIKNNASLTVNGNLDQGANIQVESFVNGNGSFILRGNQTNINPADLIYLRYVSGNNWHLFSSPATGIDIDVFAAATALAEGQNNNRGIGFYDNNTNPRWTYYQNGANDTGNFIDGKGYSLQTSANAFLILTGKLKSTDLSNYVITENLNGWNLVGNPYPANINANVNADANENFLTENADQLDPAFANIYLWNPSTTSYEPIGNGLGAKYIAPGQAFFVKSKNGGGAININKSMLTHQIGNLFLKENETKKIVLKIDDNTNISETTIAFKNGMTLGLDTTYDAAVFSGESTNLSLYTHLLESNENVPFGIQFLPELENNDFIIPLGIAQNEASEITLSLKETSLSADQKIYIEDRVQNTFTEISNVDYKFSHQNDASETGRFFLHFQQKALNTETFTTNKTTIYKESESSVQINGAENGFLNIYTLTGKKVIEKRKIDAISKSIELPKLAKGLYLFEVKTNSRRIVKKIIF